MRNLTPLRTNNEEKLGLLNEAIQSFNGAALKFGKYYQELEQRVRELDIELKYKNQALEKNLKEKEEARDYLHSILESLSTGVIVVDLEGRITSFNHAAEEITGFTSERVIGKKFSRFFNFECFLNMGLDLKHMDRIESTTQFETEICRKEKGTQYISISISPVKNSQKRNAGTVLTLQDITIIKSLEERANRAGRLAAMGEMAARIAHEIRNPLGSIELFASLLRRDLEGSGQLKELAEHISSGVQCLNNIVSNMLLFIKPQQKPEFQVFDIHDPLNDSLFFSSHMIKTNDMIEVITRYSSLPLKVYGDLELLKQAALNLVLNAIQAMPKGGTLSISTREIGGHKDSSMAEIKFVDTGTGIASSDLSKIFDPFFSTKERGTGLGLAIVHNIIKLHGGTIDIHSSEGEGTVCTITLPLWNGNAKEQNSELFGKRSKIIC